jgi:pyruvate kinase
LILSSSHDGNVNRARLSADDALLVSLCRVEFGQVNNAFSQSARFGRSPMPQNTLSKLAETPLQRARTKIVATVGPACDTVPGLSGLVEAGVDVFRLNMAHGSRADHDRVVDAIDSVRAEQRPLALLVDLAGPKIRLGQLHTEPTEIHAGTEFRFVRGTKAQAANELVSNYDRLIDDLQVGDNVMLADGTVAMAVLGADDDSVLCRAGNDGTIRSRQGINLPGVQLSLPALTDYDRKCAEWAASRKADFVSLSFVRGPAELIELRKLLASYGCHAPIVAKIEKPEALQHLDAIVRATDAVMVARGDLGVEIDVAEVPMAQKRIVQMCNRLQRPVIVATQMLDSMQEEPRPTRAEASDVANAILDGADACMLSGETAIGKYPLESVKMMNRIMLATEKLLHDTPPREFANELDSRVLPITQAVIYGAARIAEKVRAKLVVIVTQSGATAIAKSSQRDFIPVVAVSENERSLRQMCLLWGITPLAGVRCSDEKALREFIFSWGRSEGTLTTGDCVVVVTGEHIRPGAHNLVVVFEVD